MDKWADELVRDHMQAPVGQGDYCSPETGAPLRTIANPQPTLPTWQRHELILPVLCPASGNPGPGSWLRIRYRSQDRFIEVFSLTAYLRSFIGHPRVRDVEQLTQLVARDCMRVLGRSVCVEACFVLPTLAQSIRTRVLARPPLPKSAQALIPGSGLQAWLRGRRSRCR